MPRESILVVDDDPASLNYMSLALSEEFAIVRTAEGGHEALLAMEGSLPDLVITDLHMPEPDGLALLALVKERWPEVPVIVATVDQEVATVVEAVRRGAINYLPKPVSPTILIASARRALTKWKGRLAPPLARSLVLSLLQRVAVARPAKVGPAAGMTNGSPGHSTRHIAQSCRVMPATA